MDRSFSGELRMSRPCSVLLLLGTTFTHCACARAGIILETDFFSSIPHTLVTFQVDGSGNPVDVNDSPYWRFMPLDEYASLGFTFSPGLSSGVAWVKVNDVDEMMPPGLAALDNHGDFNINFTVPVRAFGFFVGHATSYPTPAFEAYSVDGQLIETAYFEGDAIDQTVGLQDFGFLGIVSTEPITRIHVTGDIAGLDNFRYSQIPEPATVSLLLVGGLWFVRRHAAVRAS